MRGWWTYVSVRELICDLSEVLVCLPFTEGPVKNRCSMSFGGSESRSQKLVHGTIYSEAQGDSKQKLAVGACGMLSDSITWRSSRCSVNKILKWVRILWKETKIYLPVRGSVLRKTWIYPTIVLREVTAVAKLLEMVHYSMRFISIAKFSTFFCGGIWREIIWRLIVWHLNIIPPRIFLSPRISWELILLLLHDFPWIFCAAWKWDFSEFLWWGVSVLLTWAKMTCFTCHRCLLIEISCFLYLFDIMKLGRISTFIALGW